MKTLDFIKANIGEVVYLTGDSDLACRGELKQFILYQIPLKLIKLSKGGRAIVLSIKNNKQYYYSVPPSNVRLYKELSDLDDHKTQKNKLIPGGEKIKLNASHKIIIDKQKLQAYHGLDVEDELIKKFRK